MLASELKLAARNLTRHKVRTAISLSAIAFGVVALLIAGGFVEWIFWAMRDATIHTGLGNIHITRPGFREAGLADPRRFLMPPDPVHIEALRKTASVTAVDQRLTLSGLISSGNITIGFTGEAVDPEAYKTISNILPVDGDNLSAQAPDAVLVGRGLAQALGVHRGDTVTFVVSLPRGGISAVDGKVAGTFATQVKAVDDSAVRMPLDLGRRLLRVQGAHNWVVGLSETEDTEAVMQRVRALLPADRYEVTSWLDLSDFYRKAVVLLSRQIDVVAILIGVIIVLGISNTITMNVLERTGEVGTIMAIGTPRASVLRLFVLEGALLGLVGGAAGLVIGFVLAQLLSYIGIPMPPPPGRDTGYSAKILLTGGLAASAVLIAVVSSVLASLYPAWRASRLPVVDALRHNR